MRAFLLFFFLFCTFHSVAQLKKGREQFESGNYEEAIKSLRKDFYGKDQSIEAGVLLAKCYYKLMEYPEALDVMNTISKGRLSSNDDMRFYADVLVANEDFTGAYLLILESLSIDYSDEKTLLYLGKVGDILEWDTATVSSAARQVDGLNTQNNEFGPYLNGDELWFISDITTVQSVFPAAYNNSNLFLYYKAILKTSKSGAVQKPSMLIKKRQYYYHDGPLSKWDGTNNYALTLRDIDGPIKGARIGIYFSQMTGKEDDITPFKYNEKYNTGHPTFANKGKRLIFASDRPGGYGLMDLWYCDWENGAWSEPVNMGPTINTPFSELYPTYFAGRLYFSSDRLDIGYGGLDVYHSSELFGYNSVINLRAPINTAYDDFGVTFLNDVDGFVSSNRRPGSGGDDIYSFVYQPFQEQIDKVNLQILASSVPKGTTIEIFDLKGQKVASTVTSANGKIEVENLNSDQTYRLKVVGQDIETEAVLVAYDNRGKGYGPFQQIGAGEFLFQLLPNQDFIINQEENIDMSYLQFNLKGRVVAEEGAPMPGVPVSLMNDKGEVVQTVESEPNGQFNFSNVDIGKTYSIKTEGVENYHEIDIYGESGAIVQSLAPVGNNIFAYLRETKPTYLGTGPALITQKVIAVVPTMEVQPNSIAELYSESEALLSEPPVDVDGFMNLANLHAGKAYRLHLKENIRPVDKLFILTATGDTAQTVRPFDDHNYIFEYLIYADYGQAEVVEIEPVIVPKKASVYRAKIKDYFPTERKPFVLENLSDGAADTVYCATNGTLIFKTLNDKDDFRLTIVNDSLDADKTIVVYDDKNVIVYQGPSKNRRVFNFTLLPEDNYSISAANNDDSSILSMGLSGRFVSMAMPDQSGIKASDTDGKVLATAFTSTSRKLNYTGLEVADQFVLEPTVKGDYGDLKIVATGRTDSIIVMQDSDGKYYVNFTKTTEPALIVQENNKPKSVPSGSSFDLKNIYYDFNSAQLKTESFPTLIKLSNFMAENPKVLVEIRSYSDSRGPANYNLLLSQKRADAVKNYLMKKGVSESNLRAIGKGETEPLNKCVDGVICTNAEHAENRRTQFSVESMK